MRRLPRALPHRTTPLAAVTAGILAASVIAAAQMPDWSHPPALGPAPALQLPPIETHTLSNGLPVWIVGMHEVPVVDVILVVRSGASADPRDEPGVADFTAAMLDEGAGTRTALQLADAVDVLGASLTTASSFDASTVHLHGLVSELDSALPLLADVVLRPTFPEADLNRVRAERLTSLLQIRDDPARLADAAFARLLYGAGHRYGTLRMGTEASNRAITAADLRRFHETFYRPENAQIVVVGDVTAATLLPELERQFGAWAGTGPVPAAETPAPVSPPATRRIYLIDKPGAAQSEIRVGTVGAARDTPDYYRLDVTNTIFGGSFTSRLNQNLREQHGYSYGADSTFEMRAGRGPFVAEAGVQTDKTAAALQEVVKELDGMQQPVPADELARARSLEALSFPRRFETTGQLAGRLADLAIYHLPDSFFRQYVPMIEAVTVADVARMSRHYLDPAHMLVVVAGDRSTIEGPLRAAALGPVTVVSADQVLQ